MADENDGGCAGEDILIPGPADSDGNIPYVRHTPNHGVEVGVMSPPVDGQPIEEMVALTERPDGRGYNVETLYSARKGPAKVASAPYRDGWSRIWGDSPKGSPN